MKEAWLFGKRVDLAVFLGAAAVSFGALGIGGATGALQDETPGWAWVPAIILCDVAHVWSTVFRTYLDPEQRRARARLFTIVPVAGLLAGILFFALGELTFWRVLAYLAIFHFVRQQYGWVALYRARAGEKDGRLVDTAAIYAATLWPLLHWHTHLPRHFSWFVANDIVPLPPFVMPLATALYVLSLGAYAVRAARLWRRGEGNLGKDVVVVTTALAWYTGIVLFDSDYAFTVTNVFMHGIPYFALVFMQSKRRSLVSFLAALWTIAFVEEMIWDRAVWHDRPWLFGESWEIGALKLLVVPLLALPQLTHYVLDGFIWKRRYITLSTSSP